MRIALVSDIHGNLTALEAVIADLRETAPDLVLHGGDLAGPGSRPAEVVDRIREVGWHGVMGNTDEMLPHPESLTKFAAQSSAPKSLWDAVGEMADAMRATLGEARLAWIAGLPLEHRETSLALVHATWGDCWRSPGATASDDDLDKAYLSGGGAVVVYGHIHVPFVRAIGGRTVANSGSVGQPLDGDQRASYLLIDEHGPRIRRVEYDIEKEIEALKTSGTPHWEWLARTLEAARPQMP
jgi:predicted phosphodiesterase